MVSTIFQAFVLAAITWAWFTFLRNRLVKTDLDNVPGPRCDSFVAGNIMKLFDVATGWQFLDELARIGRVARLDALLGQKLLYVFDPKALQHILVKDQDIFEETPAFLEGNRIFWGDGLLSTLGDAHKKQRKMLNPVFSITHIREMMPTFYDVTRKLSATIGLKLTEGPREVDIHHWMSRGALELIGQSGLGYSFDPLVEDQEPHPYSVSVKELIPVTFTMTFPRIYMLPTLVKVGSAKFRRFAVEILALFWGNARRLRDIIDVMHNTSVEIFEAKKRTLKDEGRDQGYGKDIMSILMKANMSATEEDRLTDDEVLGQMSTLIFAATDTTSNGLSRILHLLALNPDAQTRLRDEVSVARARYGDDIPYDELMGLPFVDAVCRETLRLYPPVGMVTRETRKHAVLPLSTPITGLDGCVMHEITIPSKTTVIVSIYGINRDPALWGPDAGEWKPERWMQPLPRILIEAHLPGIYSNSMTFLGGGRACIGFKFSQLEMKVVLSVLVSKFRFSTSSEKEIAWEMSGIVTPTVKGVPGRPQLPLGMELVDAQVD